MPTRANRCRRATLSLWLRLRNRHFMLIDAIVLSIAPALALALRHDGFSDLHVYGRSLLTYTLASGCVYLLTFRQCGLYRRFWQDATIEELLVVVAAVLSGTVLSVVGLTACAWLRIWDPGLPGTLPFTEALILLAAVGGSRFSVRLSVRLLRIPAGPDAARVLIVGAGFAGQWLAREMMRSGNSLDARPVAFLDDDPQKHNMRIMNLPVVGGREDLPEVVSSYAVDQVIIAIPNAPGTVIRQIVGLCERSGVRVKTVPGLSAILRGKVLVSQVRNVDIEDLLRREPIETDIEQVRQLLRGRRVLITGAGGSIGSELCRQVLQCRPSEMALLGHGENSIFDIHAELLRTVQRMTPGKNGGAPIIRPIIADIRHQDRLTRVFQRFEPEVVFHAAAHKHVPLMEANPTEAVANNVIGTSNVIEAARAVGVEHFVMISTDKAVNPTSVMGASKRAAELLILNAARETGRPYVAVRFGNVLGSRGSVIPIFKQQIAVGGPVTVTHPEMTRFFMTIPEAVQLVLQAAVLGRGGEVFMLDMGEPIRIVDLARDLIELSGLEVGRDIDIQFTGVRPGEKLHEELFLPHERYERTAHDKVLTVRGASDTDLSELKALMREAARAVDQDDDEMAARVLQRLVPEHALRAATRETPVRACVEAAETRVPVSGE